MTDPSDPSDPSEPARGPHDAPKVVPPAPPFSKLAGAALGIALFPWVVIGVLFSLNKLGIRPGNDGPSPMATFVDYLTFTAVFAPFVAFIFAAVAVTVLSRTPDDVRPGGMLVARIARGISLGTVVAAALYACLMPRGRQLRRRGKPRFASLDAPRSENPIAAAWCHNALTEHASVASFSHTALDLVALGAPLALVEACHRDALDEVAHTQLCFDIAASIDGVARAAAAFPEANERPPGTVTLRRVALDALVDGALLEGASSHVAALLTKRVARERDDIRRALATIAADERRHAEHGWNVVAWCVAQDASLHATLTRELALLPRAYQAADIELAAPVDGSGEAFGIAGLETMNAAFSRSLAEVEKRLATLAEAGASTDARAGRRAA